MRPVSCEPSAWTLNLGSGIDPSPRTIDAAVRAHRVEVDADTRRHLRLRRHAELGCGHAVRGGEHPVGRDQRARAQGAPPSMIATTSADSHRPGRRSAEDRGLDRGRKRDARHRRQPATAARRMSAQHARAPARRAQTAANASWQAADRSRAFQTPDLPPRFSSRRTVRDLHAAVDRLAHVVDRQRRRGHRGRAPPSRRRCDRTRAPSP